MTIVKMDSFDLYGDKAGMLQNWANGTSSSVTFSTSEGRFLGGALKITSGTSGMAVISTALPNNFNYITAGFAYNSDILGEQRPFMWTDSNFISEGDANCAILVNSDGSITIEGDSGGDLATSASGIIVSFAWNYIEVQCFRDGTVGTVEVFVNGTSVVSAVGDTLETTNQSLVHFGGNSSNSLPTTLIDDIYIAEDEFAVPAILGDVVMEAILPDADTGVADWALNQGTVGFELLDDLVLTNGDGDATHISSSTLNEISEFEMASMAPGSTAIHAVQLSVRSSKTDAGIVELTPYLESNSTEAFANPVAPSESSYSKSDFIYETDPDTASAWTEAGVNAVKIGVKVTG